MDRLVTVIIATAARPERGAVLRRAIDGVCAQQPVPEVIVVVNGGSFDSTLVAALQADTRVRYDYQALGSYPAAQRRGRELVRTEFFCFLDDDDELLDGSLSLRLECMMQTDRPDVAVCTGLRRVGNDDFPCNTPLPAAGDDLMLDLLRQNWFASSAPLFRTETIGLEFFDGQTKYYEWTLLGFRLFASRRRFAFIETPGYRLHDSAVSLSKNPAGVLFMPELLEQLLGLGPTPAARSKLLRRLANAHHICAATEIAAGHRLKAWRHHLHSLVLPGGWAFLTFTRRFLWPAG